jgi:hypothetical protein
MTIIRATCPRCGKVEMGIAAISLQVNDENGLGQYRFDCPSCTAEIRKKAGKQSVAMLVAAGVSLQTSTPAPEPAAQAEDRATDQGALPFTLDDAIDFHFLLQDDALIAGLLADDR